MRRRRNSIQSISSKAPRRMAADISFGIFVWKRISGSVTGLRDGGAPSKETRLATKASATNLWRTYGPLFRTSTAF